MRTIAKVGVVIGGWVAAFAVACVVVAIHVAATSGPDRQTYGAMFAFGDDLLFLAVFVCAALPATGAALFFLRPFRSFWLALSAIALAVAAAALLPVVDRVALALFGAEPFPRTLVAFGVLGILVAPLGAITFLLSGLIAPNRRARLSLIGAAAAEAFAFASWFLSTRSG